MSLLPTTSLGCSPVQGIGADPATTNICGACCRVLNLDSDSFPLPAACAAHVHLSKVPFTCLLISFCSACSVTAIHRRKRIQNIKGSLSFNFFLLLLTDVYIFRSFLLWAPKIFAVLLVQQDLPRQDPACTALIPRTTSCPVIIC